jgi:hypothetical protein
VKTFASLFSGGGLADVGAMSAGLKPLWGLFRSLICATIALLRETVDGRPKAIILAFQSPSASVSLSN